MAIYEYYCPRCRSTFERRRPMSEAATVTKCTAGHRAERTISNFAFARSGGDGEALMPFEAMGGGGGCACGGNCACGA